jgi:hypothetical protein
VLDCKWYWNSGVAVSNWNYLIFIMLIFYLRLAIRYHLRRYGSNITRDEMETIDNKRDRLQRLIDIFEHHGDSILHTQELTDDPNT